MLCNFYIKNTVAFNVQIKVDGVAPVLSGIDAISLMIKKNMDDADADAIITKAGVNSATVTGLVSFELTPTDTDVEPRKVCYYEFQWASNGKIETLEVGTLSILDKVFD